VFLLGKYPRLGLVLGLLLAALVCGLSAPVHAATGRGKNALSADAIATLTVIQDNADFLTQVAAMVGQVRNLDALTDDQKTSLIQGSLSDVKKAASIVGLARQATRKADADPTLAARIQAAQTVLTAAIGDVKTAVGADPLSANTNKAFQQMGAAAQSLENAIAKAFAKLPAKLQPPALALAPAAGQSRIFQSGATVHWVLSGPRAVVTDPTGVWLLTSGRTNPVEKPLSMPFIKDGLTNGLKAVETMHATATDFGAWTYVYYQLGHRRPALLLLNLGAATPSGSGGNNSTPEFNNLGGAFSLTKTGGGTLVLMGANSYNGSTVVNGGTLVINGGNAMGSGNITLTSGNLTISGNIAGAGSLTKSGAGALTLDGTNVYTSNISGGAVLYFGGVIADNPGGSSALVRIGTGNLNLTIVGFGLGAGSPVGTYAFTGNNSGTLTIGGDVFSLPIDQAALPWQSLGLYELLSNGTSQPLTMRSASERDVALPSYRSFRSDITFNTGNATVTIVGSLGNGTAGNFTKIGSGTLVLNDASNYTGVTTISLGTLRFSSIGAFGNSSLIALNGGTLQWASGTADDISDLTLTFGANGGTLDTNGNDVILANAIGSGSQGNLTKTGNGTLTLTGNNTYTGETTVNAGTLVMTNWNYLTGNIFVLGSGTFAYQPSAGTGNLTVSAVASDGSAFPWGDSDYDVTVLDDGSWGIGEVGVQIVAIDGGYEILSWTPPAGGVDSSVSLLEDSWAQSDPAGALAWVSSINSADRVVRNQAMLTLITQAWSSNVTLLPSSQITKIAVTDTQQVYAPLLIMNEYDVTGAGELHLSQGRLFLSSTSVTIRATPVNGSAYPWGDTTAPVTVNSDCTWEIPTFRCHISPIESGFAVTLNR